MTTGNAPAAAVAATAMPNANMLASTSTSSGSTPKQHLAGTRRRDLASMFVDQHTLSHSNVLDTSPDGPDAADGTPHAGHVSHGNVGSGDAEQQGEEYDHADRFPDLFVTCATTSRIPVVGAMSRWLDPVAFNDPMVEARYLKWQATNTVWLRKASHLVILLLLVAFWITLAIMTHQRNLPPQLFHILASCGMAILWLLTAWVIWRPRWSPAVNLQVVSWLGTASGVLIFISTLTCTSWSEAPGCVGFKQTGAYGGLTWVTGFVFLVLHGMCLCLQVRWLVVHMGILYCVWFGMFIPQYGIALQVTALAPIAMTILLLLFGAHSYQYQVTSRLQYHMLLQLSKEVRANEQHLLQVHEAHTAAMHDKVMAERASTIRDIHEAIMGYVCHQIRNPLHALRGSLAHLLTVCTLDHRIDAADLDGLEIMSSASTQLAKVSDDVLDFQRLQNGSQTCQLLPTRVTSVLEAAVRTSRVPDIQFDCGPTVPTLAQMDAARVIQMLCIGISNATKHRTPATPIKLQCCVRKDVHDKTQLQFEVWNDGEGLGTVNIHQLFEPYARPAAATPTEGSARLGLGLPIARLSAVLMGGHVGLEDRGRYTVYWFSIPWTPDPAEDAQPQHVVIAVQPAPAPAPPPTPTIIGELTQHTPWTYWGRTIPHVDRLSVMIVDDLLTNRRLLRAMLQKLGHTVMELEDGDQVLGSLLDGPRIDVLLLDIHMVRTDGRDTARLLRDQGYTFPIMAVTGNVSLEDIRSYHASGFDGVMGKPFSTKHLSDLLAASTAQ